jgi:hypothetical protein
MSKIIITQPNYIPWKGYFSCMENVTDLVLYDNVQYTKRDWRNRNYLISPLGPKLLSIPVYTKGKYFQKINEVKVSNEKWFISHWKFIETNYSKSKYFDKYEDIFKKIYFNFETDLLSDINFIFLKKIIDLLEIKINIHKSSDLNIDGDRNTKLLNICKFLNADTYLSGPSAKCYLDENMFNINGIKVEYHNYNNFKKYKQNWNGFYHYVSILDMFFNLGDNIKKYFN